VISLTGQPTVDDPRASQCGSVEIQWYGFLDQSQVLTLWINGDFMTVNILAPGFLGYGRVKNCATCRTWWMDHGRS
jgi:hypothetical protein